MGVMGAMNIAGAVMNIAGSISQGYAEKSQAEANAAIYEAQARNIGEAQKITASQYRTKANVLRGTATANAARSGLKISGSTANSISQSITQLQIDNSYEQYNLALKKHDAYSNAVLQRLQGKQAFTRGLIGAGISALESGRNYYEKYWNGASNSNNVSTWFKGQSNKIRSWGNTRLSGGLPTTNRQTLQSSGTLFA